MKYPLKILLLLSSILYSTNSIAQQKLPYSFTHKVKKKVPKHKVSLTPSEKQTLTRKEKVIKKEWEQDFKEIAKMEKVKNGAKVWRSTFEAPDAQNIGFKFNTCELSENSQLFFYDDAHELVIGPITQKNLHETQQTTDFRPYLYIPQLFNNKITIELYEPKAEENNIILNQVFANNKSYPKTLLNKWQDNMPVFNAYKKDELLKEFMKMPQEARNFLHTNDIYKKVDINLNSHGQWQELTNGDRIWRLKIKSFMAERIVLSGKSQIPVGATVFLYNPLKTYVVNEFSKGLNHIFHWGQTPGAECIIEYYEPATVKGEGIIHITSITHGISKELVELAEKLYLPNSSQKTKNK